MGRGGRGGEKEKGREGRRGGRRRGRREGALLSIVNSSECLKRTLHNHKNTLLTEKQRNKKLVVFSFLLSPLLSPLLSSLLFSYLPPPLLPHSSTMSAHEGDLYCKNCHKRNYGLKGYGYGQGAGVLASETEGADGPSTGIYCACTMVTSSCYCFVCSFKVTNLSFPVC